MVATLRHATHFIGGEFRPSLGTDAVDVICPSTEEVVDHVALASEADIDAAVTAARRAFDDGPWPRLALEERRAVLARAGEVLAQGADALTELITAENGIVVANRHGHVGRLFEYHTSVDLELVEDRRSPTGSRALVRRAPVGVTAAIIPWNAPLYLGLAKVLPALLAGCTVVLKPPPETPLHPYVVAEAFAEAGLPDGVLNVVTADREVSESLVRHPGVDKVSFTGSTAAGRRIGAICGNLVRRASLELGGKSAAIVLDDADVPAIARRLLDGGMLLMNGQACAAWTRILVSRRRHDELVAALCGVVESVRVGDPFDPTTEVGPLVARRQRERVESYLQIAAEEGATPAIGGGRPAGLDRGWYVEPTVLVGVDNGMRVAQEEIFGPVVCVIPYDTEDDAVRLANDSAYGLAGAVFTDDVDHGADLASRLRTGTVGVNCGGIDVDFPFGGFKDSGLGRQHGPQGVEEFLEWQTIGLPA